MFKEELPEDCPGNDSPDQPLAEVWRFLRNEEPSEACFSSHAGRGRPCPEGTCPCRWASCSLFIGDELTSNMMKTPMFKRFKARAKLEIAAGSGRSQVNDKHVDFWAYEGFSFLSAVVKVVPK